MPQAGDIAVYDGFIHASVHDGLRASRLARPEEKSTSPVSSNKSVKPGSSLKAMIPYAHNSVPALHSVLSALLSCPKRGPVIRRGSSNVFIAVEALYSMGGTLVPLLDIVALLDELLPRRNGNLIFNEAHSTGLYGPSGRGLVAYYGLENIFFARLHTFGKALASSGGTCISCIYAVQITHFLMIAQPSY